MNGFHLKNSISASLLHEKEDKNCISNSLSSFRFAISELSGISTV